MDEIRITDALTGAVIAVAPDGNTARVSEGEDRHLSPSVFFPGCSLLNYAPALVSVLADFLAQAGVADGTSLLCCGKILDFEEDGAVRRAAADEALRTAVAAAGVERIVAACPNCAAALKRALSGGEGAPAVEVAPLPRVLAEMGCRIDEDVVARVLEAKRRAADGEMRLWVHDSCPDRDGYGFGRGVRALLPDSLLIEENLMPSSRCCGSAARAAGRFEAALAQGARRGDEAASHGASALVTACMSCAPSLALAQEALPVVHYLEFICDYPMDWRASARPMALRFLLEDEGERARCDGRAFMSLSPCAGGAL
ncbi:(Fe-S)-binding protein [Adlercreutzia sp. R25]|uniref:(Fe-S)-binding protein n=1 Tax=Adlercreutzia shanghongiae TaxID=3111773 RepID=A0ABU6IXL6_9ACTN|nr:MULTISPECIES: (Fe-S)-binding protein [unclassified Adlercreutzia]MEC4272651.1 (Fe-S)-binding protein [Adlercreutzia sp. R25]MEC4294448.1 (Fe-S)-binding protein [Adlercreutzia sp. R22]